MSKRKDQNGTYNKVMYAIFSKMGDIMFYTLSEYRKDCIKTFFDGSGMTWDEAKKYGCSCSKVDVSVYRHRDYRKEFRS